MCVIIYNKPGELIDQETIEKCARQNSDGMGLVLPVEGKLHVYKEMTDVEKFYDEYVALRLAYPEEKIVLHFRMSTQGALSLDNAHPFLINENLAFVHNGVVSGMGTDGEKSDTVIYNENVLQKLPADFYKGKTIMTLLEFFTGSNKFVFLDSEGYHRIVNEEAGEYDQQGNWFSNTHWKYRGAVYGAYGSSYGYGGYGGYGEGRGYGTAIKETDKNNDRNTKTIITEADAKKEVEADKEQERIDRLEEGKKWWQLHRNFTD